jgi:hypothetical protein
MKSKIFMVAISAFMAGAGVGVLGGLWVGGEPAASSPSTEVRFVVSDPHWWPKPPHCPPPSTIIPPVTHAL